MAVVVRVNCNINMFNGKIGKGDTSHILLMENSDRVDMSVHTYTNGCLIYTPIYNLMNGIDHREFITANWKNEIVNVKPYEWVLKTMLLEFGMSVPKSYNHRKSGMDMDDSIIDIGAIYMLDLCLTVNFYYLMLKIKIEEI